MDINNPIIQLCVEGTQAEFDGRIDDARTLYMQAWEAATDDYEACVAAHYVARHQPNPLETFRWNQEALRRADAVTDDRVRDFYGSLYVNMGHSYQQLGDQPEAARCYALAAGLGVVHRDE